MYVVLAPGVKMVECNVDGSVRVTTWGKDAATSVVMLQLFDQSVCLKDPRGCYDADCICRDDGNVVILQGVSLASPRRAKNQNKSSS